MAIPRDVSLRLLALALWVSLQALLVTLTTVEQQAPLQATCSLLLATQAVKYSDLLLAIVKIGTWSESRRWHSRKNAHDKTTHNLELLLLHSLTELLHCCFCVS